MKSAPLSIVGLLEAAFVMTDQAVPASPLCSVNSAYWLQHDIAPDGVCRRCQMRFGGPGKSSMDESQSADAEARSAR